MKTALYPGTFDPITYGHLDVIERAAKICDNVIVAVAENPKKQPLFTTAERVSQIEDLLNHNKKITVKSFSSLLVEFAKEQNAGVIIRGLRAVTDFEYEMQMALMNRRLDQDIDTVFLMPNLKYTYLNSSIVREVASHGGDVSNFVAEPIAEALKEKFNKM